MGRFSCGTMWLAKQLCTRLPIRSRVGQQRRGMGFFGDLKDNFKKELDKNKELKAALEKMNKKQGSEQAAKDGASDASAQPEAPKAEGEGAPKVEKTAMFADAIKNLRSKVSETVEAAKQSEAAKLAQEAREEIMKNTGAANLKAPNLAEAAEGIKDAAGESMIAKAAREAAEALKKQAGGTDAAKRVKQMQAERFAERLQEDQQAKMDAQRPKKSYFKDIDEEPAEEIPEELHDTETAALVSVKRRSSTWEKQRNRMRQAVDGNPYLKKVWNTTEKVAEFTGEKAADIGDSCFGENDQSNTVYEIKERDPDFSTQDFLRE